MKNVPEEGSKSLPFLPDSEIFTSHSVGTFYIPVLGKNDAHTVIHLRIPENNSVAKPLVGVSAHPFSYLRGSDCSRHGSYVVTLCTVGQRPLLGELRDGVMEANGYGRCVSDSWLFLPDRFREISLDALAVLPSHVHAILTLRGGKATLGGVVRTWKAEALEAARQIGYPKDQPLWKERYTEQLLRNEKELWESRSYLWNNARMLCGQ